MAVKVLFWFDIRSYSLMDTFIAYFGYEPIVIDPDGRLQRGEMPTSFDTLELAKAAYPSHTWVWMCTGDHTPLEKFDHPAGDDVIYAFGHNVDGMGPEFTDEVGSKVSLGVEKVWDYIIAPQVLYDRKMQLAGRRV
jgi:hypothetical protein